MVTDTLTDPRDGNIYRTVQIGAQRWLAENLKYLPSVCPGTTTPDGSAFHYVYDYQGDSVEEAKATANYRHYGVLYNWLAAQEACPPGWHLPSDAEWSALTDFLIHTHKHITPSNVGYALRSRRQVGSPLGGDGNTLEHPRWEGVARSQERGLAALRRMIADFIDGRAIGHGTDEFGFSALPGGRTTYGGYYRIGDLGYWWSATEASPLRVWSRQMTLSGAVNRWDMSKNYGYSVRCIQD
ncbi:MAG: hypothetical protein KBG20_14625 [Caldilineaceae bacterium]|nr:hypothetical protein [Caldilineaceae bacterium]MBP8108381.1 hypothetical protein [Caldilineaceae bacterium]MBP8123306.1 hypothetical protein [Caldilineaceae bacterium]MBP9073538.1 hypothetical protein [Caldilineaceae bacterium]